MARRVQRNSSSLVSVRELAETTGSHPMIGGLLPHTHTCLWDVTPGDRVSVLCSGVPSSWSANGPGEAPLPGPFACSQVTPPASLTFLGRSMVRCPHPASEGWPSAPWIGCLSTSARSGCGPGVEGPPGPPAVQVRTTAKRPRPRAGFGMLPRWEVGFQRISESSRGTAAQSTRLA